MSKYGNGLKKGSPVKKAPGEKKDQTKSSGWTLKPPSTSKIGKA
jgi:hypothetical protein